MLIQLHIPTNVIPYDNITYSPADWRVLRITVWCCFWCVGCGTICHPLHRQRLLRFHLVKGSHPTRVLKHALETEAPNVHDLIEENLLFSEMGAHLAPNLLPVPASAPSATVGHADGCGDVNTADPEWYIDAAKILVPDIQIGVHTVHFLNKVRLLL